MFSKKRIFIGILIAVITPLIIQYFFKSSTEIKSPDGSVGVISQSVSFTYLSYSLVALCIFVLYMISQFIWHRLMKK